MRLAGFVSGAGLCLFTLLALHMAAARPDPSLAEAGVGFLPASAVAAADDSGCEWQSVAQAGLAARGLLGAVPAVRPRICAPADMLHSRAARLPQPGPATTGSTATVCTLRCWCRLLALVGWAAGRQACPHCMRRHMPLPAPCAASMQTFAWATAGSPSVLPAPSQLTRMTTCASCSRTGRRFTVRGQQGAREGVRTGRLHQAAGRADARS